MKKMLRKKLQVAITCWSVIIGMLLLSSPAFARDRYSSNEGRNTEEKRHTYSTNEKHHTYSNGNRSSGVRVVHHYDSILPAVVATGIIAGITFSLLDNNANAAPQPVVATTCPMVSNHIAATSSVMVTTSLLNVRSGPGLNQALIRQISRGTVLSVIGSSDGWYMVRTSDGSTGWVMVQFTTPVTPPAAG